MSALSFQRPIDRPALVNSVLGKVFGVSRSGFLRAGQSLGELDGGEWSRILSGFRRSAPIALDSRGGVLDIAPAERGSAVNARDPVSATLLQELRSVRAALAPALARLPHVTCFEEACAEDARTLGDMILLSLASLERAISDAAPVNELRSDIRATAKLVKRLGRLVSGTTPETEVMHISLRACRARLRALLTLLGKRWLSAPVADALQTVEQCGRCIEEGIADVHETARELGLDECEMDRVLVFESETSLLSILQGLGRSWALITQIAGLEGGDVLTEVRRIAIEASKRIATQMQGISEHDLGKAFALADEDAERLHRTLIRLRLRAECCAGELAQVMRGRAPAVDVLEQLDPEVAADPSSRSARLSASIPQASRRADASAMESANRAAAKPKRTPPASASAAKAVPAPPSADTAPMQDLERD